MTKYKVGDEFTNDIGTTLRVVAIDEDGNAVCRTKGLAGVRVYADLWISLNFPHTPKPAFFRVGKYYRWDGLPLTTEYVRYKAIEIYETKQPDGSLMLQAHVEVTGIDHQDKDYIEQGFLDMEDFNEMVEM